MRRSIALIVVTVILVSAFGLAGCRGSEVPDVVGLRQDEAVRVLQDAGFKLGDVSAVATTTVEIGMVAAQDPPAGSSADEDTAVSLAISFSDGKTVIVPTILGLSPVTAEQVANSLRLNFLIVEQYAEGVPAGEVGSQVPSPGAEVGTGATLVAIVSKGAEPEQAEIPDVAGKSKADGSAAIEAAGFAVEVFEVFNSGVPRGSVIGQVPSAGTSAIVGSKVQIAISLGAGTGSSTVPPVTGKKEADAGSAIKTAGLVVRVLRDYDSKIASGVVIRQFPDAGATAAAGSEVIIVVSRGPEPAGTVEVPDVTGQTAEAATKTLDEAGFPVTVQELPSDTTAGTVGFQFPSAGSPVMPGTPVLIVVAVAP